MEKIVIYLSGTGCSKIGMGKIFMNKNLVEEIFDEADKVLDFDIKNFLF